MHMARAALLAFGLLAGCSIAPPPQAADSDSPCPRPSGIADSVTLPLPGKYLISMTQEEATPATVEGELHLVCEAGHWGGTNMYGWIKLDFRRLGVAVPSGISVKNSDHPGVLVSIDSRSTAIRLWVGSALNHKPETRNGRKIVRTDGSGIVLNVKSINAHSFSGSWERAGIVFTGSGEFSSARTATARQLILLCHTISSRCRLALAFVDGKQELGECDGDLPAQGRDRVSDVSLRTNRRCAGCDPRIG